MNKIIEDLKESFTKGFKWGFKSARGKPVEKSDIRDSHKSLAQSIFDTSCLALNETGTIYPIIFLVKEDNFMPLILSPTSLEELNVPQYVETATKAADEHDAEALIFISEQWQVKRQLSDEEINKFEEGKLRPSLDPDRQETLCLFYVTSKGKMRTLMGDIERMPDNTPFVRDSKWDHPGESMTELFQPWR